MPMKGLDNLMAVITLDGIPDNHAAQLLLFIFGKGPKTMTGCIRLQSDTSLAAENAFQFLSLVA